MIRSATVFEEVVEDDLHHELRLVGDAADGRRARLPPRRARTGRSRRRPARPRLPQPGGHGCGGRGGPRDTVRAGYRSAYFHRLAASVAAGELDLEELGSATPEELPDAEVAARLLALPGVGPYAAAHVMMMLGRYSRLILDSWTRPKYAKLAGRKATDKQIERRFKRYGRYSGLAFWLFATGTGSRIRPRFRSRRFAAGRRRRDCPEWDRPHGGHSWLHSSCWRCWCSRWRSGS